MVEEFQPKIESSLKKEQKIGFVLLLIFAILAIGLGFLQIRNTMYGKFALNSRVSPIIKDEINTVDVLRFRDTDRDGITDFDELYIYGSSPYLIDTDSDGLKDNEEITRGTDPNCAEGKNCAADITLTTASASSTSNSLLNNLSVSAPTEPAPEDLSVLLNDPAKVRELLKGAGVDEAVLKKVSDADLMKMVADIMNPTNASSTVNNIKGL